MLSFSFTLLVFMNEAIEEFMAAFILLQNFISDLRRQLKRRNKLLSKYLKCRHQVEKNKLYNRFGMKITNSSVLIQCLASQKKRLLPYRVQLRYLLREIYSRIFKYNNFLGTHNIISWAINDIKTQIGKRE
ncbi:hypothetical protein KSF78_0008788 [Schistosoma japonicum]|nr:hypothetical protein KSF78_0008788 [Schistosoma japonicum]